MAVTGSRRTPNCAYAAPVERDGTGGPSRTSRIGSGLAAGALGVCAFLWVGPLDAATNPPAPRVGPTYTVELRLPRPAAADASARRVEELTRDADAASFDASVAATVDAEGPTGIQQQLVVVVPPTEDSSGAQPGPGSPVPVAPGSPGPGAAVPGTLPQTGSTTLTLRLALAGVALVVLGVLALQRAQRGPRGAAPDHHHGDDPRSPVVHLGMGR